MNFKKMSAVLLSGFCMVAASALMAADNSVKAPTATTPAQANVGQAIDNTSMPANAAPNSSMPSNMSMPGTADDVTPDTATGDDDY